MYTGVDSNGDVYFFNKLLYPLYKSYDEKIVDIVLYDNDKLIILLENGKSYYTDVDNQLICINDEFEELRNEKIININGAITLENGKAYYTDADNKLVCINDKFEELRNEKIINIGYDGEITLENGKAYYTDTDNQLICINDEFEELRNEKIINIKEAIILENGRAYYTDADSQLICINEEFEELKNEKIINMNGLAIILENGKAYRFDENDQLICINEEFEELKNGKIVNISCDFILLENENIYYVDDNELINCKQPELILEGKNIEKISAGGYHTVAIDEGGKVYAWGINDYGQLGDGTNNDSNIPICISDIPTNPLNKVKIKEISAGYKHTVAIDEDGKVYAWGRNYEGQLGDGTNNNRNIPICISDISTNLVNIKEISAGGSHTVAIDENGNVYAWGRNYEGQLGDGTNNNSNIPICISDISTNLVNIQKISAVGRHTVAIDEEGKVYAWGNNGSGQLGDGTYNSSNIPICISDISANPLKQVKIKKISAGWRHTVAIDEDGKVYTWGDNHYGQLGDGTNNDSNIPICISNISGHELNNKKSIKISANGSWTIIIDSKGEIYIWGNGEYPAA